MTDNKTGTLPLKTGLGEMLKGGVIMDVTTPEQARIAEDAGAVAVMALERVPADIRKEGGVARMADPEIVLRISLHRDGHDFTEAERVMLNLLLPHVSLARQRLQASRVAARNNAERPPLDAPEFQIWVRQRTQWGLTPREGEVLFWLCQGKTNAEIGRILGIAERTAETHALRIYPKMGVENRYTAIATLSRLWAGQGG